MTRSSTLGLEIRIIPTPSTPKTHFFCNCLLLGYVTGVVQATNCTALTCGVSARQVRSTLVSGHTAVKAPSPSYADFVAEVVGAEWAIGILKTMVNPILPLAP